MSSITYRLMQFVAVVYSCGATAMAALWLFGMPEVELGAVVLGLGAAILWLGMYLLSPRPVRTNAVADLYLNRTAVESAVLSACIAEDCCGGSDHTADLFDIAKDEMSIFASEHGMGEGEAEDYFESMCDELQTQYELCKAHVTAWEDAEWEKSQIYCDVCGVDYHEEDPCPWH